MDHQTHSRYNTMPEYASDRLTVDIIEARLRAKFGNKKYFVEVCVHQGLCESLSMAE